MGREALHDRIAGRRPLLIVEPPEADRLKRQNRFGGGAMNVNRSTLRLASHLFQPGDKRGDDLWLRLHLQAGGAGRPGGVAAEEMLLRWRNIALRSVGKFHIEVQCSGGAVAQFEPREGVDLVGERGNRDIANADRLQLERGALTLVEDERLPGIHLRDVLGQVVSDAGGDRTGPGESRLIGHSIGQRQHLLHHRQGDVIAVGHLLECLHGTAGHGGGIFMDRGRPPRGAIVHPHQIAAGSLRQGTDERSVAVARFTERRGDELGEEAEIIGGDRRRTEVML